MPRVFEDIQGKFEFVVAKKALARSQRLRVGEFCRSFAEQAFCDLPLFDESIIHWLLPNLLFIPQNGG